MGTNLMPAIAGDLGIEAARNGHRDEAIRELSSLLTVHMDRGVRVEIGCAAEALVQLLVERSGVDDLAEAHRIVDSWQIRRPGVPAADLWSLKCRAILADAEGDAACFAELADQYLALCEKLDARGRLAQARRMASERRPA
jgi:adenylate cyclase